MYFKSTFIASWQTHIYCFTRPFFLLCEFSLSPNWSFSFNSFNRFIWWIFVLALAVTSTNSINIVCYFSPHNHINYAIFYHCCHHWMHLNSEIKRKKISAHLQIMLKPLTHRISKNRPTKTIYTHTDAYSRILKKRRGEKVSDDEMTSKSETTITRGKNNFELNMIEIIFTHNMHICPENCVMVLCDSIHFVSKCTYLFRFWVVLLVALVLCRYVLAVAIDVRAYAGMHTCYGRLLALICLYVLTLRALAPMMILLWAVNEWCNGKLFHVIQCSCV